MSTSADTSFTSSRASTSSGSLAELLKSGASRQTIAAHLDALTPSKRVEQVGAIGGRLVGKLYDAVDGNDPLTFEDIVPADEHGTVILEGKNSLPAFTHFQKRFARVGDTIVGYNHQVTAFATGPGFFIVREPSSVEPHPTELFIDYTTDPPGVPQGWPPFKPNDVGLSRLVYMNMKDFCRRVSKGVLVGKAYKLGVAQNAFFTLTRPY